MTNIESGEKLIKKAEDIFKRDLKGVPLRGQVSTFKNLLLHKCKQ